MTRITKIVTPALLIALAPFAVGAAPPDPQALNRGKRASVDTALQRDLPGAAPVALDSAIERAAALTGIEIDSANVESSVRLVTEGDAVALAVPQESGAVLVVDLHNAIPLPDMHSMVIDGGDMIGSVTTELVAISPQFVTRARIELNARTVYEIRNGDRGVTIVLRKTESDPAQHTVAMIDELLRHQRESAELMQAAAAEITRRSETALTAASADCERVISRLIDSINDARVILLESELIDVAGAGEPAFVDFQHSTEALRSELAVQDPVVRQASADLAAALDKYNDMNDRLLTSLRMNADAQTMRVTEHEGHLHAILTDTVVAEPRLNALLLSLRSADAADAESSNAIYNLLGKNQNELLDFIDSIVRDLKDERTRLDAVLSSTDHAARLIAAKTARGTTGVDGKLLRLDAEFEAIRTAQVPVRDGVEQRLRELNTAMARVADAPATYDLNVNATAALSSRSPRSTEFSAEPPLRREQPAATSASTLNPQNKKYKMLLASNESLARAERDNLIVMAQARDSGISDSRAPIARSRPDYNLYRRDVPASEDPLQQLVNIDFREMDLTNVVSLLAQKAQISVMAGAEVSGTVTANLQDVPLGRAIEIILRMHGLGIVEESGVYRITTYEEAVASRRETRMIFLKNTQATDVQASLEALLTGADSGLMSISSNAATNILILAGPSELVLEFEDVVERLDVAEPVIPTVTVPIKLNYAQPADVLPVIQPLLSESGQITGDVRSRQVIVTDLPIKVEDIIEIIHDIDLPVKQVSVEAMIVDAIMDDRSQTGLDWTLNLFGTTPSNKLSLVEHSANAPTTSFALGQPSATAGQVAFGILTSDVDVRARIMGEVASNNGTLLANPTVVTIENQAARISISEEIPFVEQSQTDAGGSQTSTEFKEVGTVLEVTPRVTHDDHIIVNIDAKQSDTKGVSLTGIPIEDKREATTTLRLKDGQTVYIGGLRKYDDDTTVRKVPILGDLPILNVIFSNRDITKENVELLIFLTCHVLPDTIPDVTPYQKERYDQLGGAPERPDATRAMVRTYAHPEDLRDPFYKWRRTK